MSNWKSLLNDDAIDWLLEESNPHVRYFALRWLLGRPETNQDVAKTRQAIAQSAPIRKILQRQRPEGYWGSDARPHHGTRGPLMLLMWLGAPKNDVIEKALDYRIKGCLLANGAYGIEITASAVWRPCHSGRRVLLPCHGAELLRLIIRYGYADDPRGRKLLGWLVRTQQSDGVWSCVSRVKPFPCMWATADILRAFRELPSNWITAEVRAARDRAVELFLNSNLCRYGQHKPSPDWFQFGFPLQWTSDILDVLESVAPFVTPIDKRIREGLDIVLKKQDKKGRWACEKHPKGGKWIEQYIALEKIGEPSKWVTLHAQRMLKTVYAKEK
jgi:hypothetical protein